jgi:hypothetical protein
LPMRHSYFKNLILKEMLHITTCIVFPKENGIRKNKIFLRKKVRYLYFLSILDIVFPKEVAK